MSVKAGLRSRHLEKRNAPARDFKPLDPKAKSWPLCKLVEKGYRLATDSLSLSLLSLACNRSRPATPFLFLFFQWDWSMSWCFTCRDQLLFSKGLLSLLCSFSSFSASASSSHPTSPSSSSSSSSSSHSSLCKPSLSSQLHHKDEQICC